MQTIVFGDGHGDRDAVHALLREMGYNADTDRVICTGDLIDRGHDSKGLLDDFLAYGWESARGNHDDKAARLARGNPVKVSVELADTVAQLGEGWQERYGAFLDSLPMYVAFEDENGPGYIVHAGVSPDRPIEGQSSKMLLMGRTFPFEQYVRGVAPKAPAWQDSYQGHLGTIMHGHHVFKSCIYAPLVYSLDGGSVFGGVLRGIRLGSREIFEVPGTPRAFENYKRVWGDALDASFKEGLQEV